MNKDIKKINFYEALSFNETKALEKNSTSTKEGVIEKMFPQSEILYTNSATSALEICALALELEPGDEVIVPAFTFVTTASAFTRAGFNVQFCDIDEKTGNISYNHCEKLITSRTKAIVLMHYAGVGKNIEKFVKLAKLNEIILIEDAAQCINSKYNNQLLGGFGDFSVISFHETKNIHCFSGGALIINNKKYFEKCQCIFDKGTNRRDFTSGKVNKYEWVELGSSFEMNKLAKIFLMLQLNSLDAICEKRLKQFNYYFDNFDIDQNSDWEIMPPYSTNEGNGHIFYLLAPDGQKRVKFISDMKDKGVSTTFHYGNLQNSKYIRSRNKISKVLNQTTRFSNRVVRMPLYHNLTNRQQDYIIETAMTHIQRQVK